MENKRLRERGENWTAEEKDLFLRIMRQSAAIVDNKGTDTETNKKKNIEWLNIQQKFIELSGKFRDVNQLKGVWRRMKMDAKKNNSTICAESTNDSESESVINTESITYADTICKAELINNSETQANTSQSYEDLEKKCAKLMEEERILKVRYHKQELRHQRIKHKLEIEILFLEKEKKELEMKILKQSLS